MQPITLAMQNILPPKDMGLSTGTATFFRQIGATLGVAVFFSLLFSMMGPNIKDEMVSAAQTPEYRAAVVRAAGSDDPQVSEFAKGLIAASQNPGGASGSSDAVMSDTSIIEKLPAELGDPIKEGFANSMDTVFLTVSIVSLLAIIGTVTWKELCLLYTSPSPRD